MSSREYLDTLYSRIERSGKKSDSLRRRETVSIDDALGFRSIGEACNALFDTGCDLANSRRRASFVLRTFKKVGLADCKV